MNLDLAMAMARGIGEPDVRQIVSSLLRGEPAVTLDKESEWKSVSFWLWLGYWLAVLAAYALLKKEAVDLIIIIPFLLPGVAQFFKWLTELFKLPTIWTPMHQSGPTCEVSGCDFSADYTLDPTGGGEIKLCFIHKTNLERRVQYAPLFQPGVAKSVIAAYRDLAQAARLDPHSTEIQENLKQARELAQIVLEGKLE